MPVTRRSFFAALIAPFVARFLPKPKLSDWTVTIETGPSYEAGLIAVARERFAMADKAHAEMRREALNDLKFYRDPFTDPHLDPARLPA